MGLLLVKTFFIVDCCKQSLKQLYIYPIQPPIIHLPTSFLQVFCTNVKGNTYGTNQRLSRDKSAGLG